VYPYLSEKKIERIYQNFSKNIFEKSKITQDDANRSISLINKYKKNRDSLLDVGCGNGQFMSVAVKFGWKVEGVDTSNFLVNYVKEKLNYVCKHGDFLKIKLKKHYDIVTLNQVIEHFTNPKKLINNSYKALKKNGLIYIATPNILSSAAKFRKIEFDYLIPPEHLCFFNERTLVKILEDEGFKVLEVHTWSYSFDLAGIVKSIFKKDHKVNFKKDANNVVTMNINKRIKTLLFDQIFCSLFKRLLNLNNSGTMIGILAQKI